MRAAILRSLEARLYLDVEKVEIPRVLDDEVLVRMARAPINPADTSFIRGKYDMKNMDYPVGVGSEGSGVVVECGNSTLSRLLKDKRVSCIIDSESRQGTWAEYITTKAGYCFPIEDSISFDEAATMSVNPLTAHLLGRKVIHGHHKAMVQSGAMSAVGKMLMKECKAYGIPSVNIVRKPEQIQTLKALGAEYVLDFNDPDFPAQLKSLCNQLSVTIAFDSVAGPLTGQIFNSINDHGSVYVYGFLSGKPIQDIHPGQVVFHKKKLEGFHLNSKLKNMTAWEMWPLFTEVQAKLKTSLATDVNGYFDLDTLPKALETYKKNMSAGKVLLKLSE
jgi:NADPH:quinone reductase-like Zn-dependent oxidoreductase